MTAPSLWRRIVKLAVGEDHVFEQLRIDFSIQRESDGTPPAGRAMVFNLSDESEEAIAQRGLSARLDAGYTDTVATIFDGFVERASRSRRGSSRIVSLDLASQAVAVENIGGGLTNRSYDGPEKVRVIAADLIADAGFEAANLELIPEGEEIENFQYSLSALAGLQYALDSLDGGYRYHEDDGVIRITKTGAKDESASDIELSALNGLVGSPTLTDRGAEAYGLLNPLARVGALVTVESRAVSGQWKLAALEHRGNNWTGIFQTKYILRPLDGEAE